MTHYALIMLLAGVGIPILAAMNAGLGQKLGSPTAAAMVLFLVAFSSCVLVWAAMGGGGFTKLGDAPKHLLLGGTFVAFYVLAVTFIAPQFGVGNAVFFVLIGQLISAAAIDHFGLFGAKISPLSLTRAGGIAVMAVGVWITQRA